MRDGGGERDDQGCKKDIFYLTGFLTSSPATRLYCGSVPRLTSDAATTRQSEWVDHDFCFNQSHYTDTDSQFMEKENQSVERVTPGEEASGSIPAVAARSLLVGTVSV